MDMLKSDEFPRINTVLGEIETHDRSSKDGLEMINNSVQAPVLKSIYDHQEIQSVTSEICSASQLFIVWMKIKLELLVVNRGK